MAIGIFRSLTLTLLAAACSTSADARRPEPNFARETAAAANAAARADVSTCVEATNGRIIYAGRTDRQLTACIRRFTAHSGRTLVISSFGGDVSAAIEASRIVASLRWFAIVRGACASSCANYLLPAMARVSVEPYSAILLHGAPSEASLRDFEANGRERIRQQFPEISEEAVSEAVSRGAVQLRSIFDLHVAFATDQAVAPEWYALSRFSNGGRDEAENWFAVADPAFVASSLGNTSVGKFWFPQTATDRRALEETLGIWRPTLSYQELE